MKTKHKFLYWVLIPLLLVVGWVLLPLASNAIVYGSKSGQIVEAETGAPISGAFVIASAAFAARNPVEGGTHGVMYRTIVQSDANGRFEIPSSWSTAVMPVPFVHNVVPRIAWTVTVVKPGYILASDENQVDSITSGGRKELRPRSTTAPPQTQGWMGTWTLAPLKLKKRDLTPRQASTYYSEMIGALGFQTPTQRFLPAEVAVRKAIYDELVPLACNADPKSLLDWDAVGFAYNPIEAVHQLQLVDPTDRDAAERNPVMGYKQAGHICMVMMTSGAYP